MQFTSFWLVALATTATAQTVYLIRHGEKPANGDDGLDAQGLERAQCLRTVFGADSQYNIGYIIAEKPKKSSSLTHPVPVPQTLT